jgi:cytochrome oxidase Cu insertion factor (SCO1/SenC/PrrC family)
MLLPEDYEPAVRDPKKLKRTAWILVAIMLGGGLLVLKSYEKWAVRQSADDRPSIAYRIPKEKDLRIIRHDGKTVDLFDLRGHVWLINVISLNNPPSSERSLAVMKRLAAKYSATPDFNLVSLAVDPMPAGEIVASLAKAADSHAMKLPQWWLGGNEPATLHKFIKNELKASVFPHEENGRWVFDSSIVLIDRNGHIRRAVVPQKQGGPPYVATFDFDQAAKWDAEGKKTGTERSNEAELEVLLEKTIDTLLAETAGK